MATRFTVQRSKNQTFSEKDQAAESVIEELREKINRLKFRLLDFQNQNQMLRKEMLLAKKVINTELSAGSNENFKEILNQATTSDFRGRRQKINLLKDKLNELQNKIKELEEGNLDGSPEEPKKASKVDIHQRTTQNKQIMDKELQYLLENSCHLKRKLEIWKKRNAELNKEMELLRLEHDRLLEKSSEDRNVHESYRVVEKELRCRQSEKLDLRNKLEMEKCRNEQLVEELQMLKDDLPMVLNKISDDKVLIDAFNNQQGYLHDLLEHQKMIAESDNRRYRDDLREIQTKHATNTNTLGHLKDIVNERRKECRQLQQLMQHKKLIDEDEKRPESAASSVTETIESEKSQPDEQQSSVSTSESQPQSDGEEPREIDEETVKLKEECERYKSLLQSRQQELETVSRNVLSSNERLNEWMTQLLQTRSQYARRNAEVRDLEDTAKRLEKPLSFSNKRSPSSPFGAHFVEEMEKKNDILNEENLFLISLQDLLMSAKENTLEVFSTSVDCLKKLFVDAIDDLITNKEPKSGEREAAPEL